MDSQAEVKFTMDDLLRIALGIDNLCGVNTIVLHSLLNLVLKKLGCENEKISLSGYDAKVIEELLRESKITPLVFECEEIKNLQLLKCLNNLENQVNDLEKQLNDHVQKRKSNKLTQVDPKKLFESLKVLLLLDDFCESICSPGDPDLQQICDFIADKAFHKQILQRTMPPVVWRLQAMMEKIENFDKEFAIWFGKIGNHLHTVSLLEESFTSIASIETELCNYRLKFLKNMGDVQDILHTKFDRYQMLSLRMVVDKQFADLRKVLNGYLENVNKQRPTVSILNSEKLEEKTELEETPSRIRATKCGCQKFLAFGI